MLSISEKINIMLGRRHWSQAELARRSKITPQQISYYVNGEREPSKDNIKKLARAFDVEPAIFLDSISNKETLLGMWDLVYEQYNDTAITEKDLSEEEKEIRIIQRAARNMTTDDRKKAIDLWKIAFEKAFDEDGKN